MNETKITRFLAEMLGWAENTIQEGNSEFIYWITDGGNGYSVFPHDFDPIHKIEHAFMVEDAIAKMGKDDQMFYAMFIYGAGEELVFDNLFRLVNATAEQRSEAAVRVLATDAQIEEWL